MRVPTLILAAALGAVLAGCGSVTAADHANHPAVAASPVAATVGPSSGLSVVEAPPVPGPNVGPLTPLSRRTTASVTLRTFTQSLPGGQPQCNPVNDSCVPTWCQPSEVLVTELSTPAMAAVLSSPVIGLGAGSALSLLDVSASSAGFGSVGDAPVGPVPVGMAEGSPVHVVTLRTAPDVATVRLHTSDGDDSTTPVRGLAVLAVPGASTSGTLTALDADGQQVASLPLPAEPMSTSKACAPQPRQLPAPGPQPADPAAAAKAVRAAFTRAFTATPGGQPYFSLSAVEGGSGLHAALDQLRKNFPQAADTVTVSTGKIVFTSPTTAALVFTLTYTGGAPYGTQNGTAVLSAGHWLVSRSTYCGVLSFGGASCPTA